jgi:hypothetical protein
VEIEPIEVRSLPLQVKRINSAVPISAITNSGKPISTTNLRTGFQRKMQEKLSAMNVNGLSAISSLQRKTQVY